MREEHFSHGGADRSSYYYGADRKKLAKNLSRILSHPTHCLPTTTDPGA
jgi:hypothetical protein